MLDKDQVISNYFNQEALIFLNDIYREERRIFKETGENFRLEKPNPYSLISSARNIKPSNNNIAYIGDTASDFRAVQNANKEAEFNFSSICIYGSSTKPEKLKNKFKELGANLIIDNPNNLLELFEKIGRKKI